MSTPRGTIVNEWDDVDGCDLEGCKGHLVLVRWNEGNEFHYCSRELKHHADGTVSAIDQLQGDTPMQGDTPIGDSRTTTTTSPTLQQALETAYFEANGDRFGEEGFIDLEFLYTESDLANGNIGDTLLEFLLRELVFENDGPGRWSAACNRIDQALKEVTAVRNALHKHCPEWLE